MTDAGAINATADITIDRTYEPPAPPTIRDFINPAVGDKFYDTKNQFQQEVLTGKNESWSVLKCMVTNISCQTEV